ncbi:MAG: LysR family transcriptional regulator [Eubacteriaceae bacterium]|nr:LysR family transcriptional regulator [Eubacteriaceae bacterium]
MRLEQLYIFRKIAESSSIRQAAEDLYITPQYASKAMLQFEEELGTTLYSRSRTGIELTSQGKEAYELTLRAIADIEELKNHFLTQEDTASSRQEPVSITCCSVLEPVISGFVSDLIVGHFPSTPVQLDKLGSTQIMEMIGDMARAQHGPDIVIMTVPREKEEQTRSQLERNYRSFHLFDDELCLQVPKDHPLTKRACIPMKELTDLPMLLYTGTPSKMTDSELILQQRGYTLTNVSRTANLDTTSQVAMKMNRFCFVGFPSVEFRPMANVEYIPLEEPIISEFILLVNRSVKNVPFAEAMIECLDSTFSMYGMW